MEREKEIEYLQGQLEMLSQENGLLRTQLAATQQQHSSADACDATSDELALLKTENAQLRTQVAEHEQALDRLREPEALGRVREAEALDRVRELEALDRTRELEAGAAHANMTCGAPAHGPALRLRDLRLRIDTLRQTFRCP